MKSDSTTVDTYIASLGVEAWIRERWEATGKKLNMGKSRVPPEDLIAAYERSRGK